MSDLMLDEKTSYAAHRAKEIEAQKHFYDLNQPFFPLGFSITYRNPGHWDIYARACPGQRDAFMHVNPDGFTSTQNESHERAFAIRGEPGNVFVRDERWNPHGRGETMKFKSVVGAMVWICEELMQEPPEGD